MKEEWAARANCIGSQNVGFAKGTQLPKKQTKYQNIAQIITKEIKTKKLEIYNQSIAN